MKHSRSFGFVLALLGLAAIAPSAKAYTTLTGVSDFAGVSPYSVAYNSSVSVHDFSSAVTTSDTVPYDVYLKSDATTVYGMLESHPVGSYIGENFANVYLSTLDPSNLHSNIGFEVTTKGGFVPGSTRIYDLSSTGFQYLDTTAGDGGRVIEWSMPWTFFTTDPLNMGFSKLAPGGTYTSSGAQAFGYNFVAGTGLGASRFGQITYTGASAAPEPSQIAALGFSAFGVLGLILKARMRRKTIA